MDFERMLMMQEGDGSFGAGLCYRFARGGMDFFHRGLTAALAVLAVREWDRLRSLDEQGLAETDFIKDDESEPCVESVG